MALSLNTCLPRSTTSSVFFDIAFATLSANIDEEIDVHSSYENVDTTTPILPDKPSWWFYNFRMYSQLFLFLFNVGKCIYSVINNDTDNAILSAVRSLCVLGILVRHYYVCNYKFMDLVLGKLTRHLITLQIVFMALYGVVGAISGGIDRYFASESSIVMVFFLMPIAFRGLSFASASLYSKVMTTTSEDGTMVVQEIPPLLIMYFYGTVFYFSLAGSNSTSMFFTDRVLCGSFFFLSFASIVRSVFNRERKREQVFIELSQYSQSFNDASINEVVDESDSKTDSKTDDNINGTAVFDHKVNVLELNKQFTENKIFVLITPVACTFMIIMSFELAMSMYLYQRDGVPANWCEPFSFNLFDKGFQVVLDYFL